MKKIILAMLFLLIPVLGHSAELEKGKTYYFKGNVYNFVGLVSVDSTELIKIIPPNIPITDKARVSWTDPNPLPRETDGFRVYWRLSGELYNSNNMIDVNEDVFEVVFNLVVDTTPPDALILQSVEIFKP